MPSNFTGLTSYGVPIMGGGGIPATPGRVYFVDYGAANAADAGDGTVPDGVGRSPDKPWKTLEYAYSKARTNKFDIICLIGSSTHVVSNMVTTAKNRLAIIGLDSSRGRMFGAAAKISMGVTTAATDLATILNTGVRNIFSNVKVISNNTKDESLYGMIDAGEYAQLDNVEVYKSTDMDVTGAAEFVCNGDSGIYTNCTFGSLATARSGAVIRAAVLFTKGLGGSGKVTRDAFFKDCNLWINASNTANRFAYGANATDIERICVMEGCRFINNGASAFVPAQNVAFGASLTVGSVLLNRCTSVNAATAMSTTTGVFVDGAAPTAATSGISVQAS
jgi:hypothetical protein